MRSLRRVINCIQWGRKRNHAERRARKCSLSRGLHFWPSSIKRLRRLQRNLLQNPLEQQITLVPPIVPEAIFIQIGLQILGADVMVHAADSALHSAPKAFDCVGVNITRNIDFGGVSDALVSVPKMLKAIVPNMFIGEYDAFWQDEFTGHFAKSLLLDIRRNASHNAADALFIAALDHADNGHHVFAPEVSTSSTTVEGFIHLDRRALQLQTFSQEQANLLEHAPRGFVGNASFALNLLCGDAAASRTHEVHGIKPSLERSSGLLKDCASERVDVVPARLAGIGGAIAHAMMLAVSKAFHAPANTVRPALFFDVLKARAIMREFVIEIPHRVAQLFGNTLFRLHGALTS
jgi:hypothetical protein